MLNQDFSANLAYQYLEKERAIKSIGSFKQIQLVREKMTTQGEFFTENLRPDKIQKLQSIYNEGSVSCFHDPENKRDGIFVIYKHIEATTTFHMQLIVSKSHFILTVQRASVRGNSSVEELEYLGTKRTAAVEGLIEKVLQFGEVKISEHRWALKSSIRKIFLVELFNAKFAESAWACYLDVCQKKQELTIMLNHFSNETKPLEDDWREVIYTFKLNNSFLTPCFSSKEGKFILNHIREAAGEEISNLLQENLVRLKFL